MKIIIAPNEGKVDSDDVILILILKICDTSVVKPLSLTFRNLCVSGMFPDMSKKANHCHRL